MTPKKFKEWKICLLLLLIVLCFNKIFTEEYQNTEEEIERFRNRPPLRTHYPLLRNGILVDLKHKPEDFIEYMIVQNEIYD